MSGFHSIPTLRLVFFLLLVGCGDGKEADNNHGYGFHYDVQGASGLKLRYKPHVADGDVLADINQYEFAFSQTKACAETFLNQNLSIPAPFVILSIPADHHFQNPSSPEIYGGGYIPTPPLIIINIATSLTWIRHEMTHYILDQVGFPIERNMMHDSDIFVLCDGHH